MKKTKSVTMSCLNPVLSVLLASTAFFSVTATGSVHAQIQAPINASINIPAQPLSAALIAFSRQTQIEIFAPTSLSANKQSSPVKGNLAPEDALKGLLVGTGLQYRFSGSRSVVIEGASAQDTNAPAEGAVLLDTITVSGGYQEARGAFDGYLAGLTATATKSGTSLLEIPQSVNVIGREEIESHTASRLSETLRYTPGVTVEADGVDSRFDSISIRGFNTENATWLDGMAYQAGASLGSGNNWTIPQIDPFTLERVEILKGPSSSLYGQLPPGGMINQLSKRPSSEQSSTAQAGVDGFGKGSIGYDWTGPLTEGIDFRIIAKLGETGARISEGDRKRTLIAPSIAFDVGEGKLTLHAQWQRDRGGIEYTWLPAYGTLWSNPNGDISRKLFTGDPDFYSYDRDQTIVGYEYETPLGNDLTLRHALRWSQVKTDLEMIQTDLWFDNPADWDWRTMERYAVKATGTANNLVSDTSFNWDTDIGDTRHRFIAGVDYASSKFNATRLSGDAPSLDLFNPVYGQGGIGNFELLSHTDSKLDQLGLYVQDQAEFGNWRFLAGLRHDWTKAHADNEKRRGSETIDQKNSALSGRLGLLYLFDNGVAPYLNYGTSFQPVVGADFEGDVFKPMRGKQFEVGVRYAPSDDLLWSAALFDTRQTNRLTDDTINGWPYQVQTGEVRSRGFETELKADLSNGWGVTAGYSYVDTKITSSEILEELNQQLIYSPRHQASLWVDYTVQNSILEGWKIGSGARYTGSSRGGDVETPSGYAGIKIPGYTLVDFRLSAPLSKLHDGAKLNFSVSNLFDKKYVSGCGSNWTCGYGYGRTMQLTVSSTF